MSQASHLATSPALIDELRAAPRAATRLCEAEHPGADALVQELDVVLEALDGASVCFNSPSSTQLETRQSSVCTPD